MERVSDEYIRYDKHTVKVSSAEISNLIIDAVKAKLIEDGIKLPENLTFMHNLDVKFLPQNTDNLFNGKVNAVATVSFYPLSLPQEPK